MPAAATACLDSSWLPLDGADRVTHLYGRATPPNAQRHDPRPQGAFCSRAGRALALRRLLLSHNANLIELAVMTSRSLTFHRYTPPTPHHDLRWALAYLITLAAILVFLTTSQ